MLQPLSGFIVFQESGNNQVVFMQLDLASLKSVRCFAETFLKTEPRLDILINNAGDDAKILAYPSGVHLLSYEPNEKALLKDSHNFSTAML